MSMIPSRDLASSRQRDWLRGSLCCGHRASLSSWSSVVVGGVAPPSLGRCRRRRGCRSASPLSPSSYRRRCSSLPGGARSGQDTNKQTDKQTRNTQNLRTQIRTHTQRRTTTEPTHAYTYTQTHDIPLSLPRYVRNA